MQDISPIIPGKLYLSSVYGVRRNIKYLKQLGITLIINVAAEAYPVPGPWKNLNVPLHDKPDQNIISHFDPMYNIIDKEISSGGKVLVHCVAGISRSSTIVISYLMRKFRSRAPDALAYVKKRRPITSPNDGFIRQLAYYNSLLFDKFYL